MKKLVTMLLAISITATMFAGCSNNTPTDTKTPSSPSDTTKKEEVVVNKDFEIAAFQGGYGAEYWEVLVANLKAAHPDLNVKLTINPKIGEVLKPRIVAGDTPDFIYNPANEASGLMASMIKGKAFMELTDLMEENIPGKDIKIKDAVLPGFLDTISCAPYGDDKIYGAPLFYAPMGLVYNKSLFEKENIKAPATWDDFFALNTVAKKNKRALYTYQGIYPSYNESAFWAAIAGAAGIDGVNKIFNYEPNSFSTDAVKKVVENFAKIANDGYLMDGTVALNHTQSQGDFMMGKAMFIPCGSWIADEMRDSPREDGFEFAMAPSPVLSAGDKGFVVTDLQCMYIPTQGKNPEMAKELMKTIYTDESAKLMAEKTKSILPIKGALETAKDIVGKTVYGFYSPYLGSAEPLVLNFSTIPQGVKVSWATVVWDEGFTKLMTKKITPDQFIKSVEAAMAEINAAIKAQ